MTQILEDGVTTAEVENDEESTNDVKPHNDGTKKAVVTSVKG